MDKDVIVRDDIFPLVQKAMEFALKAHSGQFRKFTGLPYFAHPISVMTQIADWDICDETIWTSAVLHDVREESNGEITHRQLAKRFGADVADVVEELTFLPPTDKSGRIIAGEEELADLKQLYLDGFAKKSLYSLIVKLSDRFVNTCDFFHSNPDYAPKYWRKAESLFDAMSTRRYEITKEFGGEEAGVFPRLKYTHTTLCQMVA